MSQQQDAYNRQYRSTPHENPPWLHAHDSKQKGGQAAALLHCNRAQAAGDEWASTSPEPDKYQPSEKLLHFCGMAHEIG